MKRTNPTRLIRIALLILLMIIGTISSDRLHADTAICGGASITLPFSDVPSGNIFFCSIAEAFFSGLTNGTSGTTYDPSASVLREQMAAFVSRTMDQSLKRGSSRAALKQWFTPQQASALGTTSVGDFPFLVESDGADVWVANQNSGTVSRVRASDGSLLETWTGATGASGVLAAIGRVFVTGNTSPPSVYVLDPSQPAGSVATLTAAVGGAPTGIAFDGSRIWTANQAGSVSIITLSPVTVTQASTGLGLPEGILFDGTNIWVTDFAGAKINKLDGNGAILTSVSVGANPNHPAFDGLNIWVPSQGPNTLSVIRVKDAQGNSLATPFVVATLSGNGLNIPVATAFDGERILVTNRIGNSVSLWKATDLSPLGSFSTGSNSLPLGACSDGANFWITLGTNKLVKF